MEIGNGSSKPHAVLLASPGLGHLIPVMELGKRLVTVLNFKVTVFAVSFQTSAAESEVLGSSMRPENFEVIELPPTDISHLVDASATVITRIAVLMSEIRPVFSSAVSALKSSPTVLIVDLFGTESLDVAADKFKIPRFVYFPSPGWLLALTIYLPKLDEVVEGEYVDEKEALVIPGCKPVRPEDVVDPMMKRSDQQYVEYLKMSMAFRNADGILLNTWEDLEPSTMAALRDDKLLGRFIKVPIYPIGPMVRPTRQILEPNKELFDWLDKQPSESVVFVSFGSGGTLSREQITELAWGLEESRQRFIWVVRKPALKTGDGSFFTVGTDNHLDIASYLPEGFLDRTKNVGLVVSDWAPQAEILSHPSVGGSFSHCGWNSTLESIINGVPLIALPLYAEQKMNATMLAEEFRIAVRSKASPSKELVGREEIKTMVRKIMVDEDGQPLRANVKELKLSAEKAWTRNGSSSKTLAKALC